MTAKTYDDIIAEIHTIREQLAQQYAHDLKAYSAAAAKHCQTLGFDCVESPRRKTILEHQRDDEALAQLIKQREIEKPQAVKVSLNEL